MRARTGQGAASGELLLSVEDVSLSFGGVKAVTGVSFDIRKGEIRAIIGPNGAGKTSMLNIINGFYHPQHGRISFKGQTRSRMRPYDAARGGIARTFQNVALFKGMTALDNIMAGRTLRMHRGFLWQVVRLGPAMQEEAEHRRRVEEIIDFLKIQHIRKIQVGKLPYGLQKRVELGRALAMEPDQRREKNRVHRVRDRVCDRQGFGLLRTPQTQWPNRSSICCSEIHGCHASPDRQGIYGQGSAAETPGHGRAASKDGSVFTWNFPLLGTYWSGADIAIQHISKEIGGIDNIPGEEDRLALPR